MKFCFTVIRRYGIQKTKEKSYMYDLTIPSGDKFSFIAVDACVEPGPRRPYNFFGNLLKVFKFDK
jgi:hypothetical protein